MTQDTQTTNAAIWLCDLEDPADGPTALENEPTTIDVERSAEDEVAIHATMPGDTNALVSLYMTRADAALLAARLTATALA